jgi:hypothetical protein
MTAHIRVAKSGDVWTWGCDQCMWWGWTRFGFSRAIDWATDHRHWGATA